MIKFAVTLICLLLYCPVVLAVDQKPVPSKSGGEALTRKSDKGSFNLDLAFTGKGLKTGINTLDITVRDKTGKTVEGARITVTPWLPGKNQGVWEKPLVIERGGGRYHVENVAITMAGQWDLKFTVAKGTVEERAVFSFDIAGSQSAQTSKTDLPKGKYKKTVHRYSVPSVTLLNQDGKKLNFKSLIDSGKPVIIDFIYTTCNTICPVLSASFTNIRRELGKDAEKIQLISISIDPEHDRPEQMKKYLSRFNAGKGWDFLTGSKADIRRVLQALDAVVEDKMAHEPIYLLHDPGGDEWVRIKGLLGKTDLLNELRSMGNR